jgi:hypothetical protein
LIDQDDRTCLGVKGARPKIEIGRPGRRHAGSALEVKHRNGAVDTFRRSDDHDVESDRASRRSGGISGTSTVPQIARAAGIGGSQGFVANIGAATASLADADNSSTRTLTMGASSLTYSDGTFTLRGTRTAPSIVFDPKVARLAARTPAR